MKRHTTFLSAALGLAALPLLLACDDSVTGPVGDSPPAAFTIAPASIQLEVNRTRQFTPSLRGAELPADAVHWLSSNPEVAEVSSDGLVRARALGEAAITAEYQEFSAQAHVRVRASAGGGGLGGDVDGHEPKDEDDPCEGSRLAPADTKSPPTPEC